VTVFKGNSSKFLIYTVGFIIPFVTLGVANLAMYLKVLPNLALT
jgi:hypothetical protein